MTRRYLDRTPAWPRLMPWGAAWFVAGVIAGHVLEAVSK